MALNKKKKQMLGDLITELYEIQQEFNKYGVTDIYSNSKIFEILIANELEHLLIPGHSGSRDAKAENGDEFEYKHYKETSGNHSWTFNDYSDTTIKKLRTIRSVIFAHIMDTKFPPYMDWYIEVSGKQCAQYLKFRTEDLLKRQPKGHANKRKMINFSASQLEKDLGVKRTSVTAIKTDGSYYEQLSKINVICKKIEKITSLSQILTSNKLWELLVALKLNHAVLSEQAGHDATDVDGNFYEYKVSKNYSWNFQDISDNVLKKYKKDKGIILAIVNKEQLRVIKIYLAKSINVVRILKKKLREKAGRYAARGGLRRLQVSLSKGDLKRIGAEDITS